MIQKRLLISSIIFFWVTLLSFVALEDISYAQLPQYNSKKFCDQVADMTGKTYQIKELCRRDEERSKTNLSNMNISKKLLSKCNGAAMLVGGSYQVLETCVMDEKTIAVEPDLLN